jgi:hypothetical protein
MMSSHEKNPAPVPLENSGDEVEEVVFPAPLGLMTATIFPFFDPGWPRSRPKIIG